MDPTLLVPAKLSYRKAESPWALPDKKLLAALGPTIVYAFVPFDTLDMTGTSLAAGATAYGGCTQDDDCWVTHIVGSCVDAAAPATTGNFSVQFEDTERSEIWQQSPIFFGNALGSAQYPYWLRKPYKLPAKGQIKCEIVNLNTFAAYIQVVLWGLRKDTWKLFS